MTEYKTGDRVRVQIDAEATVTWVSGTGRNCVGVRFVGGLVEDEGVPVECLTPIRPLLKLHDEVTMGVDPEPPVGTVLVYPDGAIVKRLPSGWAFATFGSGPTFRYDWRDLRGLVAHTARVAVLPDGA